MAGSDYTFIAEDVDLERGLHHGVFLQKTYYEEARSEVIVAESAAMPACSTPAKPPGDFLQRLQLSAGHCKGQEGSNAEIQRVGGRTAQRGGAGEVPAQG